MHNPTTRDDKPTNSETQASCQLCVEPPVTNHASQQYTNIKIFENKLKRYKIRVE